MARITITLPDNLHEQVLKLAKKDGGSVSYTVTKLVELGLILTNKSNKNEEKYISKMDEHCNKLIIQLNEILKDLAVNNYGFSSEKIAQISQETISKYNGLLE